MIVIGCGKRKLPERAPAKDLYTGSLFVAARKYAEAEALRTGERWAILSAAHGLVLPEEELAPYEQKLRLKGSELTTWATDAASRCAQLVATGDRPHSERVRVLAGHPYAWPLRNELHSYSVESDEPLEGMGLGLRLQWLSKAFAFSRGWYSGRYGCAIFRLPEEWRAKDDRAAHAHLCTPHHALVPAPNRGALCAHLSSTRVPRAAPTRVPRAAE